MRWCGEVEGSDQARRAAQKRPAKPLTVAAGRPGVLIGNCYPLNQPAGPERLAAARSPGHGAVLLSLEAGGVNSLYFCSSISGRCGPAL